MNLLLIAATPRESPVCKAQAAVFSSPLCCRRAGCVAGQLLATRFLLLSAEGGEISTLFFVPIEMQPTAIKLPRARPLSLCEVIIGHYAGALSC